MSVTTTIVQLAPANHANGTITTPTQPMPVGLEEIVVRVNCTSGNPATPFSGFAKSFSDPTMNVVFGVQWSWDGGATFPSSSQTNPLVGQPTGSWAIDKQGNPVMTPEVGCGPPFDSRLGGVPNFYRGYMTVAGGPITFGLTVLETTG